MVATRSNLSLVSRNALKVGEKENEFVLTLFHIIVSNGCPWDKRGRMLGFAACHYLPLARLNKSTRKVDIKLNSYQCCRFFSRCCGASYGCGRCG